MSSTTDTPFIYHSQILPARVWKLLREGGNRGLTTTDLLMLFAINTGTQHYCDGEYIGVAITNSYLSMAANVHEKYAQQRINHMIQIGMLNKTKLNGTRYLKLRNS